MREVKDKPQINEESKKLVRDKLAQIKSREKFRSSVVKVQVENREKQLTFRPEIHPLTKSRSSASLNKRRSNPSIT